MLKTPIFSSFLPTKTRLKGQTKTRTKTLSVVEISGTKTLRSDCDVLHAMSFKVTMSMSPF